MFFCWQWVDCLYAGGGNAVLVAVIAVVTNCRSNSFCKVPWILLHRVWVPVVNSFGLQDPAQQRLCFHYSNTQPLCIDDNMTESDSLEWYPDPEKDLQGTHRQMLLLQLVMTAMAVTSMAWPPAATKKISIHCKQRNTRWPVPSGLVDIIPDSLLCTLHLYVLSLTFRPYFPSTLQPRK